jgi:hypothetical protein
LDLEALELLYDHGVDGQLLRVGVGTLAVDGSDWVNGDSLGRDLETLRSLDSNRFESKSFGHNLDTVLLDDGRGSDADVLSSHLNALLCLRCWNVDRQVLRLNPDALLRFNILLRDYNFLRLGQYAVLSALSEDVDRGSFRKSVKTLRFLHHWRLYGKHLCLYQQAVARYVDNRVDLEDLRVSLHTGLALDGDWREGQLFGLSCDTGGLSHDGSADVQNLRGGRNALRGLLNHRGQLDCLGSDLQTSLLDLGDGQDGKGFGLGPDADLGLLNDGLLVDQFRLHDDALGLHSRELLQAEVLWLDTQACLGCALDHRDRDRLCSDSKASGDDLGRGSDRDSFRDDSHALLQHRCLMSDGQWLWKYFDRLRDVDFNDGDGHESGLGLHAEFGSSVEEAKGNAFCLS